MAILVVGGDSAEIFRRRAAKARIHVEHWTGRKPRVLVRSIPKATEAIIVVLDQVNHALMKRVGREASRRGLPVYYRKRGRRIDAGAQTVPGSLYPFRFRRTYDDR